MNPLSCSDKVAVKITLQVTADRLALKNAHIQLFFSSVSLLAIFLNLTVTSAM